MTSYYKYYAGLQETPYPTLFIGGNHEARPPPAICPGSRRAAISPQPRIQAANHLWELYYGGWVAPKMMYLGHAGVVQFGGLRIGGLSGIYDKRDYRKGHFERPPYTPSSMRSAYHIRELEVFRRALSRTLPTLAAAAASFAQGSAGRSLCTPYRPLLRARRLLQLQAGQLDIFLSHDWPAGIEHFGNLKGLLARKPHFRQVSQGAWLREPSTSAPS